MIDLRSGDIKNSDKLGFLLFSFLKTECFFEYPRGTRVLPKSKDISVLIPCYGKSDTIEATVKSAVEQTMKPFQVLVLLMDDDSKAKKNSLESIDKSVECVESERLNVCKARNTLRELCPTEYFIFLDGDDTLADNYIETVYKAPASIVFTPCEFSIKGVKDIQFDISLSDKNVFLDNNFTCLFNKTAFDEIGGFDEKYCNGVEDTDIMMKLLLLKEYDITFTTDTCFYYNESSTGLTKRKEFYDSCLLALNDYLKGFKAEYGVKKNFFNPVVFKFLSSCKEKLTVEDLKGFFNGELKEDVDKMDGEKFVASTGTMLQGGVKERQKVSFALDLKCNKKCAYCRQVEERGVYGFLTEDEMFERFDKCLTFCENKLGYLPNIQLLGGEPTLWSDELFRKISKRLEKYDSYHLFTNGANKNSMFWKDPKAVIEWHITDWETIDRIEPLDRDNVAIKIVVTKKNIEFVDKFIKTNKDYAIYPGFCHDGGKEFDLDLDDIRRLAEIEYENSDIIPLWRRLNLNFYENYLNKGLEFMQEICKQSPIWSFLCYKNQVATCCACRAQSYTLDDFDGQVTKDCGDCFMFY